MRIRDLHQGMNVKISRQKKSFNSFYLKTKDSQLNVIQNLQCTLYAKLKNKSGVIDLVIIIN